MKTARIVFRAECNFSVNLCISRWRTACDLCLSLKKQKNLCPNGARHGLQNRASFFIPFESGFP